MNRFMRKAKAVMLGGFVFFDCMLLFGANGQAYIDPSVITYLIQVISGLVVSLGAFFCVYGRRIKKVISEKLGIDSNSHMEMETDEIKMW